MQNASGKIVDVYIPRKCSVSNRLIGPKDHASVQIALAQVNSNGVMTGKTSTYGVAGIVRSRGDADSKVNELMVSKGFLPQM